MRQCTDRWGGAGSIPADDPSCQFLHKSKWNTIWQRAGSIPSGDQSCQFLHDSKANTIWQCAGSTPSDHRSCQFLHIPESAPFTVAQLICARALTRSARKLARAPIRIDRILLAIHSPMSPHSRAHSSGGAPENCARRGDTCNRWQRVVLRHRSKHAHHLALTCCTPSHSSNLYTNWQCIALPFAITSRK